MLVFTNQHDGTFRDSSKVSGAAVQVPRVSRGLAAGDLLNDGHVEIVVENLEGKPLILRAQPVKSNHWIGFEMRATKSNRLALNEVVRITAGDLVQKDEVRSGGVIFLRAICACTLVSVHIGGRDEVEVSWPSGPKDVYRGLPADSFYVFEEGAKVAVKRFASSE